ncbi:hypothetical protein FACS189447_03270 [Spirochaetia bacterium]|nr:hypothetical protein FACS189447_03270 [Spirochaetia bacterium]
MGNTILPPFLFFRGKTVDEILEQYDQDKEIFLSMTLKKGNFKTDEDGNFFFDVEASNDNLDLEQMRMLQQALAKSKNYFLTNGVISKDHLHKQLVKGQYITDESYVIGEPVRVYADGKSSTRVQGKLYRNNPHAQKFIELMEAGSTRVKASVAGILPKAIKMKDGTKNVVSFLWNDLALTIAPVNYTVSPASGIIAKSLNSLDFVKAMTVGYGTDSSQFTGGRALQKEDVEYEAVDKSARYDEAVASLVNAMADGDVKTLEEAQAFLKDYGYSSTVSLDVIKEIVANDKNFAEVIPMAKKGNLFAELIDNIRKSMGGEKPVKKAKGAEDDPDLDDDEDLDDEGGTGDDDDEGGDEELVDAGEVIKALTGEVESLKKGQAKLAKSIDKLLEQSVADAEFKKSIGEGLVGLMEINAEIAKIPIPRKGAQNLTETGIQKGNVGGGAAGTARKHRQFNPQDKDQIMDIVSKAVKEEELDLHDVSRLESQINKSIRDPNFQIDSKYVSFLERKLAK